MGSVVLYVDDEIPNLDLFRRSFADSLDVRTVASASEALATLETSDIAVVISDQRMPGMTGVELLAEVAKRWPDVGRVLLTAYSDRDLLLLAIQRGHVHDYILKPWQADDVGLRLQRAIELHERQRQLQLASLERDVLRRDIEARDARGPIIGLDGDLQALSSLLDRIAPASSTVLLRGESGTGKELVARELHRRSSRAEHTFVRVNCAAFSDGLLERELFGEGAAAATGARSGRFEQANQGTLFLDAIGDMSLELQAKLLRVLHERELERTGNDRALRLDVRLIAASHRNLEDLVRTGRFREDLFFHLNVVPLRVPPLRERPNDIAALARHFVGHCAAEMGKTLTISEAALASLAAYDWPGNVRELRNLVERAAVIADPIAELGPDDFVFDFVAGPAPAPVAAASSGSIFDEIARADADRIRDALRQANGSKARAARLLGMPRTTLNDRMERLGIR